MLQCIVFSTTVLKAMMYSSASCSCQALYARISRWQSKLSASDSLLVQAIELAHGVALTFPCEDYYYTRDS